MSKARFNIPAVGPLPIVSIVFASFRLPIRLEMHDWLNQINGTTMEALGEPYHARLLFSGPCFGPYTLKSA